MLAAIPARACRRRSAAHSAAVDRACGRGSRPALRASAPRSPTAPARSAHARFGEHRGRHRGDVGRIDHRDRHVAATARGLRLRDAAAATSAARLTDSRWDAETSTPPPTGNRGLGIKPHPRHRVIGAAADHAPRGEQHHALNPGVGDRLSSPGMSPNPPSRNAARHPVERGRQRLGQLEIAADGLGSGGQRGPAAVRARARGPPHPVPPARPRPPSRRCRWLR